MLQDKNDGMEMLWDRGPKTPATPRDFEGCKPPIEFVRTQVPPRGPRALLLDDISRFSGGTIGRASPGMPSFRRFGAGY
jgi:hypothetical protein